MKPKSGCFGTAATPSPERIIKHAAAKHMNRTTARQRRRSATARADATPISS
jgi:hypothetical protein